MKKIIIPYFPTGMKYTTPLLLGGSIYLFIIGYPVWAVILILISILILTTRYVTEINLKEKMYQDYLSVAGIKTGMETSRFKTLDCIVITKGSHAQTINTRVQSRQLDWSDYTATLLYDSDGTLDLLNRQDKHELLKGLKEFSDFLNVDVEDRTTREHYLVDMTKV